MKKLFFAYLVVGLFFFSKPAAAQTLFDIFPSNNKRDPRDYGVEQRIEYHKYHRVKKLLQDQEEEEILRRLKADDERAKKSGKSKLRKKTKPANSIIME